MSDETINKKRSTKLLRFWELKQLKGIDHCRMHIRRLEKAGKFPRHIQLSENKIAWDEGEVDDLLAFGRAARVTPPNEAE